MLIHRNLKYHWNAGFGELLNKLINIKYQQRKYKNRVQRESRKGFIVKETSVIKEMEKANYTI